MMLRWLLIFFCMMAAPQAAADVFTKGQLLYRAGAYQQAHDVWLPLAEDGNPAAQYSIGVLFERGESVDADVLVAAKWYARAARQGYQPAVEALRALAPELQELLDAKRAGERKSEMKKDGQPPAPHQKPAKSTKPAKQASRAQADDARALLALLATVAPEQR
ncbi:MAG: hypothetical protein RIM84_02245 [Alphaproteobacteria bacterium]